MPNAMSKARVVKRQDLTESTMKIWLEPEGGFTFKGGQYATLGLDGIERAYSIVSSPHDSPLEFFIELVPHGQLTPRLWRLKEGDYVSMRPRAKGIFTFEWEYTNHLMICTVTGIVPFLSMIRNNRYHRLEKYRYFVLHGASYPDEFGYKEELDSIQAAHPALLTYVPTVSRPNEERNKSWKGEVGRINLLVEERIHRYRLDNEHTMVYVCGNPGMIEDVKGRLLPKGWNVKEERYWKPEEIAELAKNVAPDQVAASENVEAA